MEETDFNSDVLNSLNNIGDNLDYLTKMIEKYYSDKTDISTTSYSEMTQDNAYIEQEPIDFTSVIDAINNISSNIIIQNDVELSARLEEMKENLDLHLNASVDVDVNANVLIDRETIISQLQDLEQTIRVIPSMQDADLSVPDISVNAVVDVDRSSIESLRSDLDTISLVIKPEIEPFEIPDMTGNVVYNVSSNIPDIQNEIDNIGTNREIKVDVTPNFKEVDMKPMEIDVTPNFKDVDMSSMEVDVTPNFKDVDMSSMEVDVTPNFKDVDISSMEVDVTPNIKDVSIPALESTITYKPVFEDFKLDDMNSEYNFNAINSDDNTQELLTENNKLLTELISAINKISVKNVDNNQVGKSVVTNNSIISNNGVGDGDISDTTSQSSDYSGQLNDIAGLLSELIKSGKSRRFSNDLDL
jgi:hypothetical protein